MPENRTALRLAYADPPYPNRSARHYRNHQDYAGEVDHAARWSAQGRLVA